jgi:hypothetical protein
MKIEITKTPYCTIALVKFNNKMSFQGAGQTEEEALNVMWALYNRYYGKEN